MEDIETRVIAYSKKKKRIQQHMGPIVEIKEKIEQLEVKKKDYAKASLVIEKYYRRYKNQKEKHIEKLIG